MVNQDSWHPFAGRGGFQQFPGAYLPGRGGFLRFPADSCRARPLTCLRLSGHRPPFYQTWHIRQLSDCQYQVCLEISRIPGDSARLAEILYLFGTISFRLYVLAYTDKEPGARIVHFTRKILIFSGNLVLENQEYSNVPEMIDSHCLIAMRWHKKSKSSENAKNTENA